MSKDKAINGARDIDELELADPLGSREIHVSPIGDLKEHEDKPGSGLSCWCKPRRDDEVEHVIIHNAMDGREAYEDGSRKRN